MAGKTETRLAALEQAVAAQQAAVTPFHRILMFEQIRGDHVARLMSVDAPGLPAGQVDFSDSEISALAKEGRRCVTVVKSYDNIDDDAGADRQ